MARPKGPADAILPARFGWPGDTLSLGRIGLRPLWMACDLPANGRRMLQKDDGYVATIKSGQVTFRGGIMQGPTPRRRDPGPQPAPEPANA